MIGLLLFGAILSELDMLHGFILFLYCVEWIVWFLRCICDMVKIVIKYND